MTDDVRPMRDSNVTTADMHNGVAARHTEARAPSRFLGGLRPLARKLAPGRLVRWPRFRRRLSGAYSSVDDPFHGYTVCSVGTTVVGWHDYLAGSGRPLARKLAPGRLVRWPRFRRRFPWARSALLDHTAPGVIVHIVGTTVVGWHDYPRLAHLRAPSRLLVGLRLDDRTLVQAAGQRAGRLGWHFPWTRSLLYYPAPGALVYSAGTPVIRWHDYLQRSSTDPI